MSLNLHTEHAFCSIGMSHEKFALRAVCSFHINVSKTLSLNTEHAVRSVGMTCEKFVLGAGRLHGWSIRQFHPAHFYDVISKFFFSGLSNN